MATFTLNPSLDLRDVVGKCCSDNHLYGMNPTANFSSLAAVRAAWFPPQDFTQLSQSELANVRYPTDDELIATQTAMLNAIASENSFIATRAQVRTAIATIKTQMTNIENASTGSGTNAQRLTALENGMKQIASAVNKITLYIEMDVQNTYFDQ